RVVRALSLHDALPICVGWLDETLGDAPGIDDFDLLWTMLDAGAGVGLPGRSVYAYRDHGGMRLTTRGVPELEATFGRILDKHGVDRKSTRLNSSHGSI